MTVPSRSEAEMGDASKGYGVPSAFEWDKMREID
jgi:hypothetical protein